MISESESIAYLEELLSAIRHKLGNTVNSLQITLSVLADHLSCCDDKKVTEHLNQLAGIAEQQHGLIRALKHYNVYDSAEITHLFFPDIWQLFIDVAKEKLTAKNIKLVNHTLQPACTIKGNRNAISKILLSILDNAIDALDNRENPVVDVSSDSNSQFSIIRICDNGDGIKDSILPKVFTPFFTTRKNRSGMGLAISKMLIHQMGGKISLAPHPDGGTVASINLKLIERAKNT